jgi:hypothetical protein
MPFPAVDAKQPGGSFYLPVPTALEKIFRQYWKNIELVPAANRFV